MAEVEVRTEEEGNQQWVYGVRVTADDGESRDYRVTLSWADYDLWCRGRVAPERVVKAAMDFLLAREPASSILPRFDCSLIRRYFPEVDEELPNYMGRDGPPAC